MEDLDKLKDLFRSENTRNKQYGQAVETDYFDALEEKILLGSTQNENTDKTNKNRKSLYIRLAKYSSVAAAVALLIYGISFLSGTPDEVLVDNSTVEYTTDYLLETEDIYIEDFTEIEGIDEILDELEQQLND